MAVATTLGVLQIIVPLLSKLSLPTDVQADIRGMSSWLSSINALMEDNHGRQGSRTLLDRVDKVRKIANDIEDVLDDFILHSPPYTFHHYAITRRIHRAAHSVRHVFPLRGVRDKIASIKRDIEQLQGQAAAFGHTDSRPGPSRIMVSPLLPDDQMVGYEGPKKELMRRLVDGEKRLVRLAVDGPGGSGKTTLVKNVFWKRQIQLCKSREDPYPGEDGFPVLTRLERYLVGKRYVVK